MKLFAAILLCLVAVPSMVLADPISGAIFSFLAGAGATVGLATTVATFATRLIVGALVSLVGQLFAKKPSAIKQQGIQTEQTTTGDTTPQKFIVGLYAAEGHAVSPAYSRGEENRILTYVLEISNIPIKGLTGRVIIDGQYTALTAGTDDTSRLDFADLGFDNAGNPRGWLWFYDGTQTTAQFKLVESYSAHPDRPWTTDHVLRGTSYAVLEFPLDREIFTGLPSVRFEAEGIKLYDPRKDTTVGGSGAHRWGDPSTWEFSANPQVINYNIMRGITLPTGDIYGGEVEAEDLPLDNWFAAMNECDVLIGDRPQYRAGFEINTGIMEPFEVIEEMNRASFAQISEFGGVFRVRVGAPATPVMSLTDDDFMITEPSSYEPFPGLAGTYNAITGTYVEPNDVWEGRSADAILNAEWEVEDGDRRMTIDVGLPSVSNKSQAQQLLNAYIKDQRRFRVHRMALPPSFALMEPLDTLSWTSETNGYASKIFEVIAVEDRPDTLNQFVTVREREAGDVAWTSGQDVPAPTAINGLTRPDDFVNDNFDSDVVWNGKFDLGFLNWIKEEYDGSGAGDAAVFSVQQRNAAADEDALKYAPALNVVQLDLGGVAYSSSVSRTSRLVWRGLIPVESGSDVTFSFRHAAGDGSTYGPTPGNGGFVRGALRWYNEAGVQLTAPDDETDDQETTNLPPAAGIGWWKVWQRTDTPPSGAAFCKPVFECSGGAGLSFLANFVVAASIRTGDVAQDSFTDKAITTFGTTTLAANSTLESIATATVTVPELSTGATGEALTIDASCFANIDFTTSGSVTVRLYIDNAPVASGATTDDSVVALSGMVTKTAGDYDVEIRAESSNVSNFTITEGNVKALVYKR